MYKKSNQKSMPEEPTGRSKKNPICPDCPVSTSDIPVKEGDIHFSSKNFQSYIFRKGQWVLDIPEIATAPDAFSSSNPWWQSTNTNPYISEEDIKSAKKELERLRLIAEKEKLEAAKKARQWKPVNNVLEGVDPVGIRDDKEEYCEFFNYYETVKFDSLTFKNAKSNCFHAALYQLHLAGWDQTGSNNAYQLYVDPKLNSKLETSVDKGVAYAKKQLSEGNPVMAGISHGESESDKNVENHNKKTQHFVVLVGMGYDKDLDMNYFSFYDNGFNPKGDTENNRFYFNEKDKVFRRSSSAKIPDVMTEIRILKAED